MDKYKIVAWLGETIPLEVAWDTDITANCKIQVYDGLTMVFEKMRPFLNNVADISISPDENINIGSGDFTWLVRIEYPDGAIDILPDKSSNCENGDCVKPEIVICEVVS